MSENHENPTHEEAIHLAESADGAPVLFPHAEAENALREKQMWARLQAGERIEIRKMRLRWSNGILGSIVAVIGFDFFIVLNIGYGWMSFNNIIFPVFIVESIIKIIGLAFIIVRFLFSDESFRKSDV